MPATLITNNHNYIVAGYDWNTIEAMSFVGHDVTLIITYYL
jgi:hypothetical protein